MRLEVAVDCSDLELMTDFWSQVLRYAPVGDSDDRFDVPDRVYCSLVDPSGIGPRLVLQRVAERRSGKNRLHLDIHVPDIEAEAERIAALGARRLDVDPVQEVGARWVRLTDPEGNVFCLVEELG